MKYKIELEFNDEQNSSEAVVEITKAIDQIKNIASVYIEKIG